jgi:hypothetical protein
MAAQPSSIIQNARNHSPTTMAAPYASSIAHSAMRITPGSKEGLKLGSRPDSKRFGKAPVQDNAAGRNWSVSGECGAIPVDAKSADSRCLSALWQKQGGEEETFSPAALRLYLYTRSSDLTRLLTYVHPPSFTPTTDPAETVTYGKTVHPIEWTQIDDRQPNRETITL